MLSAILAVVLTQAPPLDTSGPGPFPVGSWDWDFGTIDINQPGGGGAQMSVDHFGTMRYPAEVDGVLAPGAAGRARPFLVFAHGRFQAGPAIGKNHREAAYLLDHLASWGFAIASVNLDVVGQFAQPSAITQRGQIISATIEAFRDVDITGLTIDFDNVGLIGHSRGGEGVLAAYRMGDNKDFVKAVATIAPTDFREFNIKDVAYLGLYGSKDGDVNNGWPIFLYDRVGGVMQKAFEYIEGANHFWFTETLSFALEGQALITRAQHHDVARTYIARFLRSQLLPLTNRSFAELSDGPALAPLTDEVVIHPMYHRSDAFVVDDFEGDPGDVTVNKLDGEVVFQGILNFSETNLDKPAGTLFHQTNGLSLAFDTPGGLIVEELPLGTDVSGYGYVSLRALQHVNANLNTDGVPQDLTVALIDDRGSSATVPLSAYGTIPWPITHNGPFFPTKSVLRTTRIPLRAFEDRNPALDLTDLRILALLFDRTGSGNLRIDDLAFTD